MSVVAVKLVPETITAKAIRKGAKQVRTYSRTYKVRTSDGATSEIDILAASGVPAFGSAHPADPTAFLSDKSLSLHKNGLRPIWHVACEWTNDTDKAMSKSPIYPETPAKISGAWEQEIVPVEVDLNGDPIVNTAGDPFDPPVTEPKPIPTLTIQVNLASGDFSESWMEQFFNAVNADTYRGKPAGTVLVQDINFTQEIWTNDDGVDITYYAVNIKLAYNKDGWQPSILSQGYRKKDGASLTHIRDKEGRDISAPVPLDEDGLPLFGDDVTAANVVYVNPTTKNEVSFSDLVFA
jgi:hypothetical protein